MLLCSPPSFLVFEVARLHKGAGSHAKTQNCSSNGCTNPWTLPRKISIKRILLNNFNVYHWRDTLMAKWTYLRRQPRAWLMAGKAEYYWEKKTRKYLVPSLLFFLPRSFLKWRLNQNIKISNHIYFEKILNIRISSEMCSWDFPVLLETFMETNSVSYNLFSHFH